MKRLTLLTTVAMALALAGCGNTTDDAASTAPKSSKAAVQTTMNVSKISDEDAMRAAPDIDIPYETFTLDNGLRVVVHEDRKTPTVAVSVWYNVGSKDERPGKTGFAHLFEHLMFNGSENYNDEYFGPFEKAGATGMNGTTWFDRTNYFQTVPTPALDMALWMESDRMTHFEGAITQDNLDKQRGVVQNEKRQGDNSPYGLVEYRVLEGLFPQGHPYRWSTIGSMDDLNAASVEDVTEWFKSYYGASNTVVVLAGDINAAEARPLMEKYFGDAPVGDPLYQKKTWVPDRTETVTEVMYDRVPQARLDRYWAVPGRLDQDAAVLYLAAQVLGSGKTSLLYKELVYDKELATDVSVYVEEHNLASIFTINVKLKKDADPAQVDAIIDRIMSDFLRDGPPADLLAAKKTGVNATYIRGLEQIGGFSGKASTLAEGALYAGDPGFWKKQLGRVNAADGNLVRMTANKWLSDGAYKLTILPFGEKTSAETGADRSALPDMGGVPDLSFPAVSEFTLSNGIKVVLATRDAVPVVQMAMEFDGGYAADSRDKLGAASFASDMMYNGTTTRSALDISEQTSAIAANIGTGAGLDNTSVTLNVLTDKLDEGLDIYADIIRNPAFSDEEIERFRKQRIAGIDNEKVNPIQTALRLLPPAMYGKDHAYGVPFTGSGTAETTNAMTRADLQAYHRDFIRPDNATLFVVGDIDQATLKPKLEAEFGNWSAPDTAIPERNVAQVGIRPGERVIIVDKEGSPQSLILGGHLISSTGAPNATDIDAMNEALGGAFTARVNMNLREDKGWAYGAYTFMQNAKGQRPWLIYAPVQTDKTGESLMELRREVRDYLGNRPITADELQKVRDNNIRSLPGQFETAGSVLGSIRSSARYGRAYDYATTTQQRYNALTPEGLRQTATETIKPDSVIWIIVGDRTEIEAPLKALGIADIEYWDTDGNVVE
ncbi:M16 family metallopeptidase [Robiginitomaculum antarcticum]|uniref:M16 family metallopeptidase n=1 Tax=Robiginitomaculum antarcticum TaxID=437507 RepID=UPI00036CF509|nr:pitrilysin family protein [Robiginitomaculum antarcticum]